VNRRTRPESHDESRLDDEELTALTRPGDADDDAVPLQDFERKGPPRLFDAGGWPVLRDYATILFGDGGAAKSYLALRTAGLLAQAGTRVLFVGPAAWRPANGARRAAVGDSRSRGQREADARP
jgi:hypothetical protein